MDVKVPPALRCGASGKAVDRQSHAAWLASEIERLETLIRPASPSEIDEAIDLVLEGHGGRRTNEAKAKAYCIALEGLPARAIALAVRDVLAGNVPDIDPDWPPAAPRLARLCRRYYERDAGDLHRRRVEQARELAPPDSGPMPEEQARIAGGLKALADELGRTAAERSLAETAAKVARDAADAAETQARAERVAAGLAGRHFPPAPSQVVADAGAASGGDGDAA